MMPTAIQDPDLLACQLTPEMEGTILSGICSKHYAPNWLLWSLIDKDLALRNWHWFLTPGELAELLGWQVRPEVPEPEPIVRLTPCEQAAIRRPNPTGDPSAHSYHVAVVSFGCGRSAGQVLTVLGTYDAVTRERWGAAGRRQLADQEARTMRPRAKADSRECR